MTVGDAISFLEKVAIEHGNDLEFVNVSVFSKGFYVERNKILDVIAMPCEDDEHEHIVVAFRPDDEELTFDEEGGFTPKAKN